MMDLLCKYSELHCKSIAPCSTVIPRGLLELISCYYQVLVEVPRLTVASGIWLQLGLGLCIDQVAS